jgi:spermidine/putrescine transport system ATP-binding protein
VSRVPPHKRNVNTVFQHYALFPHMTVWDNVAYGPRSQKKDKAEVRKRVDDLLEIVRLTDFAQRKPAQLSGGQQQRVAIARALVIRPRVLLLDEPFAALDRKLREEMQMELRDLTRRVGITSVFVTHDQEEALTLSDRVVVMNAGRIEQIGTPDAIYSRPETRFVADFMGARNILETTVRRIDDTDAQLDWQGTMLRAPLLEHHWLSTASTVAVALRPEALRIVAPFAGENAASGQVVATVDQGAFVTIRIEIAPEKMLVVRQTKADQARSGRCARGDTIGLAWDTGDLVLLRDAPRNTARVLAENPTTV